MVSRDALNWNIVMEKNVGECLTILKNCDWEQLQLSDQIQDFILNISSNHHCDPIVLLYTILSGIGHFADTISVFNMETKQVKPISVYEVLIAPSGVEKSKYINILSNSCSKIERYLFEQYYKKNRTFLPGVDNEINLQIDEKNKNIKTFDCWVSQYGSIKQVYTTPSLLQILVYTSVLFLANEGDAILQESNFYNPSDPTSDIKQAMLIDAWDGNKMIKSTISRGTEQIQDRTVSICIATTGRRWPDLLKELSKVQIAGGLHERCCYLCFDVNNELNRTQLTQTAEKDYYSSLYDHLLTSDTTNLQSNYSLAQLFFIIKLFGRRVCMWSREAFAFIHPRLLELKLNQPCPLIPDSISFQTKQQMALRRRSAEHIVRYASLMQIFSNALLVLQSINKNIINSNNGALDENFELEAKNKINDLFGSALSRSQSYCENGIPVKPMLVDVAAAEAAVGIVVSLLLPQAICLFNYEVNEHKVTEQVLLNDINTTLSKKDKTIRQIEIYIMNLNYKFFHKTCITEHHFRGQRSRVSEVLADLAQRNLLHQADANKSYFITGRVTCTKTYMKFLPTLDDEQRFKNSLLNLYNIKYDEYTNNFKNAPIAPPNCKLTSYGFDMISKPQYDLLINQPDNINSNNSANDINPANKQSESNFSAAPNDNNDDEHEESVHDFNITNQHLPTNDFIHLSNTKTTMNNDLVNSGDLVIDLSDPYKRDSFFATTTNPLKKTGNDEPEVVVDQSNSDNSENVLADQNHDEAATTDNRSIHFADDDSSSLLSSTSEEDIGTKAPQPISEELCIIKSIETTNDSSELNESINVKVTKPHTLMDLKKKMYGKVLLVPSIILTKGLISTHIKISAKEMKEALDYLIDKEFLTNEKYLQCAKRKIEAYLKYVPDNIEGRQDKYLLQRRLLDIDVNVTAYIETLKTVNLSTTSVSPSDLLLAKLQGAPYVQLNIDLSIKCTDVCNGKKIDKDEESEGFDNVHHGRRKKLKPNSEKR